MCMNCGCNKPEDRHGSDANITIDDLRKAGDANGMDVDTTMANIERAWHQSEEAQGMDQGHAHDYASR